MSKIFVDSKNKSLYVKSLYKSYKYNNKNSKIVKIMFTKNNFVFPIYVNITSYSDDEYASLILNFVAEKINIDDNVFSFDFIFEGCKHVNNSNISYLLSSKSSSDIKDWISVINCYMKQYYDVDNYINIPQHNCICEFVDGEFITTETVLEGDKVKHTRTISNHKLFKNIIVILKILIDVSYKTINNMLDEEESFKKYIRKFKKHFNNNEKN